MEKNRKIQYVEDEDGIEVVECCFNCEHSIIGYEWDIACSLKKYKRFYLGKNHMDYKPTRPDLKCELYEKYRV